MEVTSRLVIVAEPTDVAHARRCAAELAETLGFDETLSGRAAIVVTEAATNLIKHAGGGEVFVGVMPHGRGIQVVAMDRGHGIANVSQSLRDGFSTAGTAGNGLGAIRRASSSFDLYSNHKGTVMTATIYQGDAHPDPIGAVVGPAPGETECGDAWASWRAGELTSVFVCDGLGHGMEAARASRVAVETFRRNAERSAADVISLVHDALRATRGAAVAIAELDSRTSTLRYCGLGNISGTLLSPDGHETRLVSHAGIAGHVARRVQTFTNPWPRESLLVMHSDGIGTHWSINNYAGLACRRPDLIAGVLFRDSRRGRDDASVVVTANREEA